MKKLHPTIALSKAGSFANGKWVKLRVNSGLGTLLLALSK